MEYIDGEKIIDWVQKSETKAKEIRNVVNNVLRECYVLDDAGLDHGELSTIDKHVIVNKKRNTIIQNLLLLKHLFVEPIVIEF